MSEHTVPKTRKPSDRKIVVIHKNTSGEGGFNVSEFTTKTEASSYINTIGSGNVHSVYTGAKPAVVHTKATL